jgi:tRNA/rRNA methyltransferase/tRNA (cytidine32/uridine32-2'-O)-methyltransferase
MSEGKIRVVLFETSHPGNIGAAARALKTMGLEGLWLVRPQAYPHADATARASGADDVLAAARVCASLDEALAGCRLVLGTTARDRRMDWPQYDAREGARALAAEAAQGDVAVLFGPERIGLTNAEIDRCQGALTIPANPDYSSLNLGAAVQVIAYELRMALLEGSDRAVPEADPVATADELEGMYAHMEATLTALDFLDPANPKHLMRRLRRLFSRARPDAREVNIVRGILTAADKAAGRGNT